MSIRARSSVATALLCGGFIVAVGAALYGKWAVFGLGVAIAAVGVGMFVRVVVDVTREIGEVRRRSETLLRAETPEEKGKQP